MLIFPFWHSDFSGFQRIWAQNPNQTNNEPFNGCFYFIMVKTITIRSPLSPLKVKPISSKSQLIVSILYQKVDHSSSTFALRNTSDETFTVSNFSNYINWWTFWCHSQQITYFLFRFFEIVFFQSIIRWFIKKIDFHCSYLNRDEIIFNVIKLMAPTDIDIKSIQSCPIVLLRWRINRLI